MLMVVQSAAQQITGTPGSPTAIVPIQGNSLPPPPPPVTQQRGFRQMRPRDKITFSAWNLDNKKPAKRLFSGLILVAGTGFEPVTFRL